MPKDTALIPDQVEFFFTLIGLRGNETNGKELEQQEQKLELFPGLWPMAPEKNLVD